MSHNCNFCNKEFSSKSSLNFHQKTTKYCLNLQNKKNDSRIKIVENKEEKEIISFECEFCNKQFNLKSTLTTHYNRCKIKEKDEKDEKENSLNLLKEEINKLKELTLSLENENKHLKSLLKDEKDRVDELVNKKNNINTTNNIQTNIYKDNFDELFEKLPKFTQENLINSFKEVLNEDVFLQGIDSFTKIFNRYLGVYGIVSDFARYKIVIKDKDGNQVNTISPKVFVDSINNIQQLTTEVLAKSRQKVETFNIMEQDVYINNLFPIKELILRCEHEQTSDKNIMKYGKKLTDNCQVVTRINNSSNVNTIESKSNSDDTQLTNLSSDSLNNLN